MDPLHNSPSRSRFQKIRVDRMGGAALNKTQEQFDKEFQEIKNSKDKEVIKILNQVSEIFHLFDPANQDLIDVREVGCILRGLGLYPCEAEVQEIIQVIEDPQAQGYVQFNRFAPHVVKILQDGKLYQGPTVAEVATAFQVLDMDKLGYFDFMRLKDLMQENEPFSTDEFDDLLRFNYNEEEQRFDWRIYMKKCGLRVSEYY